MGRQNNELISPAEREAQKHTKKFDLTLFKINTSMQERSLTSQSGGLLIWLRTKKN